MENYLGNITATSSIDDSTSSSSCSSTSSSVKTVTLDDLKDIDTSKMDRPLNVLVTTHDIKPFYGGVYEHGLGLWINYIIEEYLVKRHIPHRLFTKSILTSGSTQTSPEDFIKFITRNSIDVVIPSDVTDTMFLSKHHEQISDHVSFAVTDNVKVYEMLEDKWETYKMCQRLDIFTPATELFDQTSEALKKEYPFFLKLASGTNAGRGVWHIKNSADLEEALRAKEIKKQGKDGLLLKQTPVSGDIVTAQIIFEEGAPVGFFFCQSVQSEDLAGMGENWIKSQSSEVRELVSDVKVELADPQWDYLHDVFKKIGSYTKYHGMMDIEFIINSAEGICLLECNPRFSGGLHTTLSNPGFLDLYFDVVTEQDKESRHLKSSNHDGIETTVVCGNYSKSVTLKARIGDFDPTGFYLMHPLKVLSLRHWSVDNHHSYRPASSTDRTNAKVFTNPFKSGGQSKAKDWYGKMFFESPQTSLSSVDSSDDIQQINNRTVETE